MKTFNLNVLNEQLDNKSYLNSSDITKFIDSSINNIIEKLSDKYISFLVEKYFRNRDELIAFITEEIFFDFTSSAINSNSSKIIQSIQAQNIEALRKRNEK